jgi:hypothetical protein
MTEIRRVFVIRNVAGDFQQVVSMLVLIAEHKLLQNNSLQPNLKRKAPQPKLGH